MIEEDNESYVKRIKQILKNKTPVAGSSTRKLSRCNSPVSIEKSFADRQSAIPFPRRHLDLQTEFGGADRGSSAGSVSPPRFTRKDEIEDVKIHFTRQFEELIQQSKKQLNEQESEQN